MVPKSEEELVISVLADAIALWERERRNVFGFALGQEGRRINSLENLSDFDVELEGAYARDPWVMGVFLLLAFHSGAVLCVCLK